MTSPTQDAARAPSPTGLLAVDRRGGGRGLRPHPVGGTPLRADLAGRRRPAGRPSSRSGRTTPPRPMPTFGSNDRSRWATVRLVDGLRRRPPRPDLLVRDSAASAPPTLSLAAIYRVEDEQRRMDATAASSSRTAGPRIDKVLHPERLEFLFQQAAAAADPGGGRILAAQTPASACRSRTNRSSSSAIILLTINVLPLVLCLWLLSRLAERYGATDWGRLFVVAAGCFGTLVTPFLITFNNHTVAAFGALIALYAALRAAFPTAVRLRPGPAVRRSPAWPPASPRPLSCPPPLWPPPWGCCC